MNDKPDNEKKNEGVPDASSQEPKKKPDLDDTISRLLRTKEVADAEKGDKTTH